MDGVDEGPADGFDEEDIPGGLLGFLSVRGDASGGGVFGVQHCDESRSGGGGDDVAGGVQRARYRNEVGGGWRYWPEDGGGGECGAAGAYCGTRSAGVREAGDA